MTKNAKLLVDICLVVLRCTILRPGQCHVWPMLLLSVPHSPCIVTLTARAAASKRRKVLKTSINARGEEVTEERWEEAEAAEDGSPSAEGVTPATTTKEEGAAAGKPTREGTEEGDTAKANTGEHEYSQCCSMS